MNRTCAHLVDGCRALLRTGPPREDGSDCGGWVAGGWVGEGGWMGVWGIKNASFDH